MTENELSRIVLNTAFAVHTATGPGLLESVYEAIMAHELREIGLLVERQKSIAIRYKSLVIDEGFRADLLINEKLIVELKSTESLHKVHAKQLLTQLRMSGIRLGLVINFGEIHLRKGIERVINGDLTSATPNVV